MTVNTKTASRRELNFASLEEALADAEALVASGHETTGNWSLGQIVHHLATSIDANIDGVKTKPPFIFRIIGRFIQPKLKRDVVNGPIKPGFQLSKSFQREFVGEPEVDVHDAIANYRSAITRLNEATSLPTHPFFGDMTIDEAKALHRNHADLHLSFARPTE